MKGIITPKNIINLSSNHKILPANVIDKKTMLIRPIIESNIENNSYKSKESLLKNNNYSKRNDNKSKIESINLKLNSDKKKQYFQNLKDKIFSPGDLEPIKTEPKTQKILSELKKKLNFNSNNKNTSNNKINEKTILNELKSLTNKITNPNNIKYLPEKQNYLSKKKTLILDLDETLVHSAFKSFYSKEDIVFNMQFDGKQHTIHVLKRPYVDEFLDKMSKLYEIVIFTASISDYANPLLNKLDPRRRICHRLFREHCTSSGNLFIKDLRKVGRDLKDTIIIDNNPISYLYNKDNGIPIITWHSSQSDNELIKMIPLLEFLSKVDDVRIVIQKVVNGNYINYTEVNKLIKKNCLNNIKINNDDKNDDNKNIFTLDNIILRASTYKDKSINNIKKQNTIKNNNNNNNTIINSSHKNNNLSRINHQFTNYYFNNNERNSIGDKIRESLNGDFENRQISNLFEDKVYQEKYNNFYDPKSYSISSKGTKSFIEIENKEELILPSNNYLTSSTKNLNIKKKNKKIFYNKLTEMKEKVNNDDNERISTSKINHYHQFSIGISNRENNNNYDLNSMTLPSRSSDKKNFSLNNSHKNLHDSKFKNYTTKVATINLQDNDIGINGNNKKIERNKTVENLSLLFNNNLNSLTNRNYSSERNFSNVFKEKFKSPNGINFLNIKFF